MGERSAIGLNLLDSSMSFHGLCSGISRPTCQMLGISALTERFMASVRYLSAMGPRWCRRIDAILSMPSAILFLVSLIASFTVLHLNILPSISSFLIVLSVFIFCFSFFLGCGVYCWLNFLAYFIGVWRRVVFLVSKYMSLFAGGLALLDESPFIVLQKLEHLPL